MDHSTWNHSKKKKKGSFDLQTVIVWSLINFRTGHSSNQIIDFFLLLISSQFATGGSREFQIYHDLHGKDFGWAEKEYNGDNVYWKENSSHIDGAVD